MWHTLAYQYVLWFYFEVICSVDTEKDTATLNVKTKQIADGTFWYSLDNNGQFQQCTYVALLDTYMCFIEVSTFINLQVHQEILYQNYQLVYITLSLNLCLISLLIFMQHRKNISLKLNLQVCTYIYLMCHVSQNILTFIFSSWLCFCYWKYC